MGGGGELGLPAAPPPASGAPQLLARAAAASPFELQIAEDDIYSRAKRIFAAGQD